LCAGLFYVGWRLILTPPTGSEFLYAGVGAAPTPQCFETFKHHSLYTAFRKLSFEVRIYSAVKITLTCLLYKKYPAHHENIL
ncbi:hypothetical protein, partial [Enterobacter intestinihominis]